MVLRILVFSFIVMLSMFVPAWLGGDSVSDLVNIMNYRMEREGTIFILSVFSLTFLIGGCALELLRIISLWIWGKLKAINEWLLFKESIRLEEMRTAGLIKEDQYLKRITKIQDKLNK